jgi:hypothetical protein
MKRFLMKRRWLVLGIAIVLLLGLAAWFEPTCAVRGWLRGEAFYQGRPTSYWSRELGHWQQFELFPPIQPWLGRGRLDIDEDPFLERDGAIALFLPQLEPPMQDGVVRWEQNFDADFYQRTPGLLDKVAGYFGITLEQPARPAVLDGDPAAEPVLRELLHDPDGQIIRHAAVGIRRIHHPPGVLWNERNLSLPR